MSVRGSSKECAKGDGQTEAKEEGEEQGRRDMINTAALFSDFLQHDPRAQIACK